MKKRITCLILASLLVGGVTCEAKIEKHKDDFSGNSYYTSTYSKNGGFLGMESSKKVTFVTGDGVFNINLFSSVEKDRGNLIVTDKAELKIDDVIYEIPLVDYSWENGLVDNFGFISAQYYLPDEVIAKIKETSKISVRGKWRTDSGLSSDITIKNIPEKIVKEWVKLIQNKEGI